ncbi:ubiquitin-conjugating enzyme/RWD-like protein [Cercophora newfieldiana]|uniref:Ubiquitin-conjugating enzyme/RWD-like protein n=1 Tax=Cercophora newfieldiana TaxID=92897 RepID=A0AA40CXL8_9PEZI|nr:ubiquitin-conjugating enzyme/RWD-like protein [Cercophora newfieldiana]
MATTKINSKSPTIRRILREAQELSLSPSPDYTAHPLESDLFEWHFTLRGPPNSPYATGIYHGRINLPPAYPLKPPSFRFVTPSGRFETNREICLSISGHHEETWQPAWGIRTALVALRSFMETDARGQLGGLDTGEEVRVRLAGGSGSYKCGVCGRTNREILEESEERARGLERKEEVVIPGELKMGFRDEMEAERRKKEGGDLDAESAELAEGFVRTGPVEGEGSTPTPTRTVPAPAPVANPNLQQQPQGLPRVPMQQVRVSNDGVPAWIDRLIVVVVVLLVAMLLKVLLA